MANPSRTDVLIIGGGLVGSAMATALASARVSVRVLERGARQTVYQPRNDGRVSAISQASARIFRHLGVWAPLEAAAEPILDIRVADQGAQAHVHFDHRAVGDAPFGYMIPNGLIRQTLQEAMEACDGVDVIYDAVVADLDRDAFRAAVSLEDGRSFEASLLLVADGRYSTMRERLGIPARLLDYDQTAMVCTIRHAKPHHGVAVELFQPAGPLAILPMTEQRSCIVWTETTARAQEILALPEDEFTAMLAEAMSGYLGALELLGAPYGYPLHLVQADRYVAQRTALIGDAAHGIHPIAGQGVNLGYRDVAVMAELVAEARSLGLDLGAWSLLEHYQRWRRFDATAMMATTDILNRLFSNDVAPLRLVRRAGLSAFERLTPVKNWFMLTATGFTGDLPRMLCDEPLSSAA
jgi:2-octaprenyl-6-methoxyphenol hydroxylase